MPHHHLRQPGWRTLLHSRKLCNWKHGTYQSRNHVYQWIRLGYGYLYKQSIPSVRLSNRYVAAPGSANFQSRLRRKDLQMSCWFRYHDRAQATGWQRRVCFITVTGTAFTPMPPRVFEPGRCQHLSDTQTIQDSHQISCTLAPVSIWRQPKGREGNTASRMFQCYFVNTVEGEHSILLSGMHEIYASAGVGGGKTVVNLSERISFWTTVPSPVAAGVRYRQGGKASFHSSIISRHGTLPGLLNMKDKGGHAMNLHSLCWLAVTAGMAAGTFRQDYHLYISGIKKHFLAAQDSDSYEIGRSNTIIVPDAQQREFVTLVNIHSDKAQFYRPKIDKGRM